MDNIEESEELRQFNLNKYKKQEEREMKNFNWICERLESIISTGGKLETDDVKYYQSVRTNIMGIRDKIKELEEA